MSFFKPSARDGNKNKQPVISEPFSVSKEGDSISNNNNNNNTNNNNNNAKVLKDSNTNATPQKRSQHFKTFASFRTKDKDKDKEKEKSGDFAISSPVLTATNPTSKYTLVPIQQAQKEQKEQREQREQQQHQIDGIQSPPVVGLQANEILLSVLIRPPGVDPLRKKVKVDIGMSVAEAIPLVSAKSNLPLEFGFAFFCGSKMLEPKKSFRENNLTPGGEVELEFKPINDVAAKMNSVLVIFPDNSQQFFRIDLAQPASQLMFQVASRGGIKIPAKYYLYIKETKKPLVLLRTLLEQQVTYNTHIFLKKKTGFQVKREQSAIGSIRKQTGGSTSSGATLIATQSFTGNAARNELSFKKGDRLTVLADDQSQWWRGQIVGSSQIGIFPVTHFKFALKSASSLKSDPRRVSTMKLYELKRNSTAGFMFDKSDPTPPKVFSDLLNHLMQCEAYKEEGLFRISANILHVQELKRRFMANEVIELKKFDVHAVSGYLKQWLRELAEPLFTYELHDLFLEAMRIVDYRGRLICIRKGIALLPPCNYTMVKLLFGFFSKQNMFQKQSKMPASNVAIIFQLHILRPKLETQPPTNDSRDFIISLIEDYDILFQELSTAQIMKPIPSAPEFEQAFTRASSTLTKSMQSRGTLPSNNHQQHSTTNTNTTNPASSSSTQASQTHPQTQLSTPQKTTNEAKQQIPTKPQQPISTSSEITVPSTNNVDDALTIQDLVQYLLDGETDAVEQYLQTLEPGARDKKTKKVYMLFNNLMEQEKQAQQEKQQELSLNNNQEDDENNEIDEDFYEDEESDDLHEPTPTPAPQPQPQPQTQTQTQQAHITQQTPPTPTGTPTISPSNSLNNLKQSPPVHSTPLPATPPHKTQIQTQTQQPHVLERVKSEYGVFRLQPEQTQPHQLSLAPHKPNVNHHNVVLVDLPPKPEQKDNHNNANSNHNNSNVSNHGSSVGVEEKENPQAQTTTTTNSHHIQQAPQQLQPTTQPPHHHALPISRQNRSMSEAPPPRSYRFSKWVDTKFSVSEHIDEKDSQPDLSHLPQPNTTQTQTPVKPLKEKDNAISSLFKKVAKSSAGLLNQNANSNPNSNNNQNQNSTASTSPPLTSSNPYAYVEDPY